MDQFTPVSALAGGALIGLSATAMMAFNGRVAGVSGIFGGLLSPKAGDIAWRAAFVGGLLVGGLLLWWLQPELIAPSASRSLAATAVAGALVGFGVRLGNGCTSGHGVCGISRRSPRSLTATAMFMATGFLTVGLIGSLLGGTL